MSVCSADTSTCLPEMASSDLSTGVLANSTSLETALTEQFEADGVPTDNLEVEEITAAPVAVVRGGTSTVVSTATSAQTADSSSSSLSDGAVIGIVAGGIFCVVALGSVALFAIKRRRVTTTVKMASPTPVEQMQRVSNDAVSSTGAADSVELQDSKV